MFTAGERDMPKVTCYVNMDIHFGRDNKVIPGASFIRISCALNDMPYMNLE